MCETTLDIVVSMLGGEQLCATIARDATIISLKNHLGASLNMPSKCLTLFYQNTLMDDDDVCCANACGVLATRRDPVLLTVIVGEAFHCTRDYLEPKLVGFLGRHAELLIGSLDDDQEHRPAAHCRDDSALGGTYFEALARLLEIRLPPLLCMHALETSDWSTTSSFQIFRYSREDATDVFSDIMCLLLLHGFSQVHSAPPLSYLRDSASILNFASDIAGRRRGAFLQQVPLAQVKYPTDIVGFNNFWESGTRSSRWYSRGGWPPEPPPCHVPAGAETAWAVFDHMGLGWPPVAGYAVGDSELWVFVYENFG